MSASAAGASAPLTVRAYESLDALAALLPRLDALNLASRRPSPFATTPYQRAFLANDEDAGTGYRPLFLVASEGDEPVGWVALRRQPGRLMGLPAERVEFLVLHDNERPHLACRAADEVRCAEAFTRHLVEGEPGWSLLEWMEQDEGSPLAAAAGLAHGCLARRFEHNPNATVECRWADGAEYYRSLSKNFRASLRSGVNRLTAAGRVTFASTWEPDLTARFIDLHLDVEARSWKGPAKAGISRHPVRVAFFRSLLDAAQPMRMGFRVMLLDGVPIASELNGAFGDTWYSMEGTYDQAFHHAGAGHLLFLMSMREALASGVRAVNLLNNYAYVKRRYGATITETAAVQVFRPWTALWAKARLGDLRRRLLGRGTTQADVDYNLVKPRHDDEAQPAPQAAPPDRAPSRRLGEAVLAAGGDRIERTEVGALLELMGKAAPGPAAPVEKPARPPRAPRPPRAAGPSES